MNWYVLCEDSDRCFKYTVMTNKHVSSVIQERSQKPQELQGQKYMPHLSDADIMKSFLFKKNAVFCPGTTSSFLSTALRILQCPVHLNRDFQSLPIGRATIF